MWWATCSGALRRWLADHGGIPRKPIAAGVPFTLRASGDSSARNRVSMMRAALATHLASPAARLREIHASMARGKAVTGRLRGLVPTDYPSLGSAWLVGALGWLAGALGHRLPPGTYLPSLAPVAISNVPGPPQTLYVAGARVVHYWPASIVIHGLALNITVQSYAQWLDIGITACRAAVPDVAQFGRHLDASFAELQQLAQRAANAASPARPVLRPVRAARPPRKAGGKSAARGKVAA
ncbi:MAG: WS/DGAT domain-containing protein, partial [Burkholderiaceae bacterium]|nr:WS/DGAT domain-containing protein [Burkholderiaceae bacterium]